MLSFIIFVAISLENLAKIANYNYKDEDTYNEEIHPLIQEINDVAFKYIINRK